VSSPLAYLDYAATAAIRPPEVADAVVSYLRDIGATPGRSGHRLALEAGRVALRCRMALAELFSIAGDPGRIAFQPNATYGLNAALFGLLRPGDRVVRTRYDHNAVRRPVARLRAAGVQESVLRGSADGSVDLDEAERLLFGRGGSAGGSPARLLVIPHVSNVLGSVLPVRELAERARAAGALVLLDAAQSAGHIPIDVGRLGVDLLAFTGHKGLLGPQGTGGLWIREGLELPAPVLGGTGGDSWPAEMPSAFPDRLEAGTQNGPGIAGLLAGVHWVLRRGVPALHAAARPLKAFLFGRLHSLPGVRVLSPAAPEGVGIVTVTVAGLSPADVALRLDRDFGVLTRAGLHCAPEVHEILGTELHGAVRFSLGWATTEEEVQRAITALASVSGNEAGAPAVPNPGTLSDPGRPDLPEHT
jgi:cysteine desulfurase / selenocysteine lyase